MPCIGAIHAAFLNYPESRVMGEVVAPNRHGDFREWLPCLFKTALATAVVTILKTEWCIVLSQVVTAPTGAFDSRVLLVLLGKWCEHVIVFGHVTLKTHALVLLKYICCAKCGSSAFFGCHIALKSQGSAAGLPVDGDPCRLAEAGR